MRRKPVEHTRFKFTARGVERTNMTGIGHLPQLNGDRVLGSDHLGLLEWDTGIRQSMNEQNGHPASCNRHLWREQCKTRHNSLRIAERHLWFALVLPQHLVRNIFR